jgi:hypothetical protein
MTTEEQMREFVFSLDKFIRENGGCLDKNELGTSLILLGASIFHDACTEDGIRFTDEMIMIKNTISSGIELGREMPYEYGKRV